MMSSVTPNWIWKFETFLDPYVFNPYLLIMRYWFTPFVFAIIWIIFQTKYLYLYLVSKSNPYIICIWPVYSKRIKPNIWTLKTFVFDKAKFRMKSKSRQMIPNLKQISRVFEATAKFSLKAKNRKMMSKLKGSRVASCCRRRLKCSWNFSNGALSCPPRPSASSR